MTQAGFPVRRMRWFARLVAWLVGDRVAEEDGVAAGEVSGGRRRRGVTMVEVMSSYGIYVVLVAGGLVVAFLVWSNLTAQQAYDGVNSIRTAAFRIFAGESHFDDVTPELIAQSGLVAENLVGADGETLFVSGFNVAVVDGSNVADMTPAFGLSAAANDARYLWIVVEGVDDSDVCEVIMNGAYGDLKALGLYDEAFVVGTAVVAPTANGVPGGTHTAAGFTGTLGAVWTAGEVIANTVQLEDKTNAQVQQACEFVIDDQDDRADLILLFRQ